MAPMFCGTGRKRCAKCGPRPRPVGWSQTAVTRRQRRYKRKDHAPVRKKWRFEEFLVKKSTPLFQRKDRQEVVRILKEDGIHSQQWADSIPSQRDLGFLSLPLELRNQIYILAFASLANKRNAQGHKEVVIMPMIYKRKYVNCTPSSNPGAKIISCNGRKCEIIHLYNSLGSVSKQMYLDVIGSGLLYSISTFQFMSLSFMHRYIDFINPRLMGHITNVNLQLKATRATPNPFTPSLFLSLAAFSSLRSLEIRLLTDIGLCHIDYESSIMGQTWIYDIYPRVLEQWDLAKWETLGGKDLRELRVKIRSFRSVIRGMVVREENIHAWIERVRKRIGGSCGGDLVGMFKVRKGSGYHTHRGRPALVLSDEDL